MQKCIDWECCVSPQPEAHSKFLTNKTNGPLTTVFVRRKKAYTFAEHTFCRQTIWWHQTQCTIFHKRVKKMDIH